MNILDVSYRSIVTIVILFFITKMLNKKQISQLSLFDYVVGITIGNIAADISIDTQKSMVDGILSLFIYGFTSLIISYITRKSIIP